MSYGKHFFQSKKEDFPWIQWKLPVQVRIKGVNLTLSNVWKETKRLKIIEVRAGMAAIDPKFAGKIQVNEKCRQYKGQVEVGGEYSIMCTDPILANFITIQVLDDSSVLRIDELRIIKDINSKYLPQK